MSCVFIRITAEVILMNTHNGCFYGEMWKIFPKLSSNCHLICFSVINMSPVTRKPVFGVCDQGRLACSATEAS